MMSDAQLDSYIEAAAFMLGLEIKPDWKASVRANLAVTLQMVALVDAFALPDEAEPAPVFAA